MEPGHGFLTGRIDPSATFETTDVRSRFPRFTEDARAANQPIIDLLNHAATLEGATAAQIALAWLRAQKPWIVPIPGTRELDRLHENLAAVNINLDAADLKEIDTASSQIDVHGARGTGREQCS